MFLWSLYCYFEQVFSHCMVTKRRIWNLIKHLWWSLFAKTVNSFYPLTIFSKKLHHRRLAGSFDRVSVIYEWWKVVWNAELIKPKKLHFDFSNTNIDLTFPYGDISIWQAQRKDSSKYQVTLFTYIILCAVNNLWWCLIFRVDFWTCSLILGLHWPRVLQ